MNIDDTFLVVLSSSSLDLILLNHLRILSYLGTKGQQMLSPSVILAVPKGIGRVYLFS